MKKKGLKFLKEKPDCVDVWLIALIVIIVVLIIILFASFKFEFCGNIPNTLLSGIIGAVLSCVFILFGFGLSNTSKIIDNQLELRKLFSEELRWEVHRTLSTGDKSCWYKKSGEEIPENLCEEKWQKSKAFNDFFLPALDDYMGVFEIAYMMIKERQMSKNNFAVSYYYRLVELTKCPVAMEKVNNSEVLYWLSLRKLIKMFSL